MCPWVVTVCYKPLEHGVLLYDIILEDVYMCPEDNHIPKHRKREDGLK
jgi:hypothetical protein